MKLEQITLQRYDADEGMVFDWKNLEEHTSISPEGEEVVNHLYAKTLFLGINDSIDNYVEVAKPVQ